MAKEIKFNIKIAIDGNEQLVTATTSVKDLRKMMDSAKGSAGRLRDVLLTYTQTVQAIQNVSNAISQITGTLNNITQESRDFGAAMREANTMAGKGAAEFEKLRGQVAGLSKAVPMARDQLARGLYQVISNGVPENNWISYLEASAKSAVGGIADVGEVVKVTSTIIKNYGLEWDAAQDIQDKIQLTAKNGVTSFEQLAAALPSVTGQASQLGVSFTEMLAVMSTLTGVTGNTSEVATQLASVLTALTKESSKSQKAAEAVGISFNAASIKAAGGLRNYLKQLDAAVTAYSQKTGALKESTYSQLFGRAEAIRIVSSLTGQMADKFAENITALSESSGTMEAAYNEMASTGSAKLQTLKNAWGKYTDWIAEKVGGIQPLLNFGSQLGMTTVSVVSLTSAFKRLHITQTLMGRSVVRNVAAYALFGTNTKKAAKAVHVMSLSFRSARTQAIALKTAVRGLMAATGVGVALMALGAIISKLVGYMDKSKDSADDAAASLDALGNKTESTSETFDRQKNEAIAPLLTKYQRLQQEWRSLKNEHEKNEFIKKNTNAFQELGICINSVKDAETAFVGNTNNVVAALNARAEAAAAASIAEMKMKEALEAEADAKNINKKNREEYKRQHKTGRTATDLATELLVDNGGIKVTSRKQREAEQRARDRRREAEYYTNKAVEAGKKAGQSLNQHPLNKAEGKSDAPQKQIASEKILIENAKTYKDLTNNVAYYQQELEKADVTDNEHILTLARAKKAAEDAVASFNSMAEAAAIPTELKTLDDYDRKLQYLRKQKQTANKESIAGIDAEIERINSARQALEDESVAALRDDEIRTYNQLNDKLAYYNRLLDSGTEEQRKFAQNGINALDKLRDKWDAGLAELRLPKTMDNIKDIDTAISFYSERQQREDADQIQKTQQIIDRLTDKKRALQLGIELPDMKREAEDIDKLIGKERKLKIRAIGFDELTNKIRELQKQLNDPENPVTDNQRKDIEGLIDTYKTWRKESISAFDMVQQGWSGIRGIGDSIQSITNALEDNTDGWRKVTAIIDGMIQLYNGFNTVLGIIQKFTSATQASAGAKTAESVATIAASGAQVEKTAVDAGAAAATVPVITANKAATASYMELASAMYFAAHASIPFAGFGIASGFVLASKAIVTAIGATPFAKGGIVSGPTLALVGEYSGASNNPEIIAPLDKLRSMMQPAGIAGANIHFEIKGRKLVGVMANETRIGSKSGRRTNIRI